MNHVDFKCLLICHSKSKFHLSCLYEDFALKVHLPFSIEGLTSFFSKFFFPEQINKVYGDNI
jgi:hypothetical protein